MKKKPSLLDIELFVQKRAEEKKRELLQTEDNSGAITSNKKEAFTASSDLDIPSPLHIEEDAQVMDNQMQTPLVIEEMFTSIVDVTDTQRDDINKLKQDIFKLKEELRVYHSFLSSQQKKIVEIEKRLSEKEASHIYADKDGVAMGIIDANYSKLLLKNIIWLKEEKDFSSNDVARLFRAEGFQTPYPHKSWNEKVINTLYSEAKKSFL